MNVVRPATISVRKLVFRSENLKKSANIILRFAFQCQGHYRQPATECLAQCQSSACSKRRRARKINRTLQIAVAGMEIRP